MKGKAYIRNLVSVSGKYEHFPHLVYVLYCPVAKQIRYVGYTSSAPYLRLASHLADSRARIYKSTKEAWICGLAEKNMFPIIRVIRGFKTKKEALHYEFATVEKVKWARILYNINGRAKNKP